MSLRDLDELPLEIDFDQFLESSGSSENNVPTFGLSDGIGPELNISDSTGTLDDDACDIDDLLEEAFKHYGKSKPAFCVADKGERSRLVTLAGTDQNVKLTFHSWLGTSWGYWVLTDPNGDKYICKCERGNYHVWEGITNHFSKNTVARAVLGHNKDQRSLNMDDTPHREQRPNHSPTRSLRKRSTRQQKPYAMDRLQRRHQLKGIQVTESELEESLMSGTAEDAQAVCFKEEISPSNKIATLQLPSSAELKTANEGTKQIAATKYAGMVDDSIDCQAILRSRLDSSTGPSIPVYLASLGSCIELFKVLKERWAFSLDQKTIHYCVARFSWLSADCSLLLQPNDGDCYRLLCDEVRHAAQIRSGRIEIDLELCTGPPS